jgi:SmpA / OmlA family
MRTRALLFASCVAALAAGPLAAQDTTTAVRPGMTEADVRTRWGDPVAVRRLNDWTYLFYRNGEERRVGHLDVVFLQNGQVMDAIVRAPGHVYLGQSSSPPNRAPVFTPPTAPPAAGGHGAAVTGVHVNGPGTAAPPPGPER